jgi:hypothetical protein
MKSIVLKAVSAGVAFAVTLCTIAGVFLWYRSIAKHTKSWDDKSLAVTEPPKFGALSDDTVFLSYTLENKTPEDYIVNNADQYKVFVIRPNEALSIPFDEKTIAVKTPVFIPSHQKGMILIDLKTLKVPTQGNEESTGAYQERIRRLLNDKWGQFHGLALYDSTNRYQINLPKWPSQPDKQ